jgi:hypothetical protein
MDRTGSVTVDAMAKSGDGTDWRLIYVSDPSSMTNYDFDPGHPRPLITTQPTTVEELRRVVDNIALSGADTLIQEVYNAAWTMFFRSERFEYDARPQHRRFIPLMDQGVMPLQVLLERARERGMGFMAGFRMNDSHGAPDQGGMFLHTHPQWKLTEMPDGAAFVPGNRMDFTFDGVRDYLYGVMEEVVDRFDVDGLELVFREGLYFPAPRGDRSIGRERQPLMTGLIERVREMLDRRGADRGRRLQLGVRVPQTVAECHDVGLDVPAWIAAGLVDYVAPMDSMYSDFNPAYEEFSSLTAGSSCRFYPGVLPYCSHRDRSGSALSLDNYRALVHTLRRQGADGISIYNYQMHWDGFRSTGRDNGSETMYPTALAHLRELADLERVARGPRHYLFHSMWGGLDAYLPRGTSSAGGRRDSAIRLQRGAEEASGSYLFRLYEDVAAAGHARLHFRVAGLTPADPLAVALNDVSITAPRLRRIWHPDGRAAPYGRALPAYTSCMFDLEPGSTVAGDNRLTVSVPAGRPAELLIDEVEVTVIPA